MESFYQNSVSEFDLNLLEQPATAQGTIPSQCASSRRLMIYRMKRRNKGISNVLRRARGVNEILKTVQKDLEETKAELEDTKKSLINKNEELKESCISRNTYYNKATKYESDLQIAKERLKYFQEKDYDYETQNRVTTHHVQQIKALETIIANKESNAKEKSTTHAQAIKKKEILEKKLVRLLTDYVRPAIKKRDKWLDTLMKKHLGKDECGFSSSQELPDHTYCTSFDDGEPMSPHSPEHKNEHQKIHESSDNQAKPVEVIVEPVEPPANTTMRNRNISLDFDFVGSVDTGRGSSLAFSDGEKSFHSPDYYVNGSPLSPVSNLCNKCNITKLDVSTSPIPETVNTVTILATDTCKTSIIISKKDACTSPPPLDMLNVGTDTSEITFERSLINKTTKNISTSPQNTCNYDTCHLNSAKTIANIAIVDKTDVPVTSTDQEEAATNLNTISRKQALTSPLKLIDEIKCNAAEIANSVNKTTSYVQETPRMEPKIESEHVKTHNEFPNMPAKLLYNITLNESQIPSNISSVTSPVKDFTIILDDEQEADAAQVHISRNESLESANLFLSTAEIANDVNNITNPDEHDSNSVSDNDFEESPPTSNVSGKESPSVSATTSSQTLNTAELNNNISKVESLLDKFDTTTSNYDEPAAHYSSFSSKQILCSPTTVCNITSDAELDINRSIIQEKQCLELNNSKTIRDDAGHNIEVQSILSNMKLREQIVTPIPTTPPRRAMLSPIKTTVRRNKEIKYLRYKTEMDEMIKNLQSGMYRIVHDLIYGQESDSNGDPNSNMPDGNDNRHVSTLESTYERICNKEIRNEIINNTQPFTRYVDMLRYDTEPEDLDQITAIAVDYKEDVCKKQSENKTKRGIENPTCFIVPENKITKSGMEAALNGNVLNDEISTNSNCDEVLYKKQHDNELKYGVESLKCTIFTKDEITKPGLEAALDETTTYDQRDTNIYCSQGNLKCIQPSIAKLYSSLILNTKELQENDNQYKAVNNVAETSHNLSGLTTLDCLEVSVESNNNGKEDCKHLSSKTELPNNIQKNRKLSKLEKLRLKMVPKSKIKNEVTLRSTKKIQFKPTPIINAPKKKLTASDTAATLNDRSVYENAVKIIAASNIKTLPLKEAKVIVEDCTKIKSTQESPNTKLQSSSESSTKINNTSINIHNKGRDLLPDFENVTRERLKRISIDSVAPVMSKRVCSSDESILCGKRKRSICYGDQISNNTESSLRSTLNDSLVSDLKYESSQPRHNKTSISHPQHSHVNSSIHSNSSSEVLKPKRRSISSRQSTDNEIANTIVPGHVESKKVVAKKRCISNRLDSDNTPLILLVDNDISSNKTNTLNSSIVHGKKNKADDSESINRNTIEMDDTNDHAMVKNDIINKSPITRNQTNQEDLYNSPSSPQRVLRSSYVTQSVKNNIPTLPCLSSRRSSQRHKIEVSADSAMHELSSEKNNDRAISYADLGLFTNQDNCKEKQEHTKDFVNIYRNNTLCKMIEQYGIENFKRRTAKKIPETKVKEISNTIETSIANIIALPHDQCQGAMKKLIAVIHSWDAKHFIVGFMSYLKDHGRKLELFNKIICPPAPAMTKQEQVLIYIIEELQNSHGYRNIVEKILLHIEYALFALNESPPFDVVESMSHFYALLCRNYQKMSKLRLFILDAMYCLQFKSLVLIKQCLEVWTFVLPLAHMGLAKSPLVTCLVYLLHFYKFEDKGNRIEDMRFILRRRYSYELSDWNETKILDIFRTAIYEVRENRLEKKMLRLALIILAKRYKAQWCHNNIVKKILQPMIADASTPDTAKRFCVSVLGPLLKPYPNNMKVHCEMIMDYLFGLLDQKQSRKMQEAIVSSLICFVKQNNRLHQFMFNWNPKQMSPEFKAVFVEYVRSKPVNQWKNILSKLE